jgi:hypothetical protein
LLEFLFASFGCRIESNYRNSSELGPRMREDDGVF